MSNQAANRRSIAKYSRPGKRYILEKDTWTEWQAFRTLDVYRGRLKGSGEPVTTTPSEPRLHRVVLDVTIFA
jgi:hypothetical protein